MREGIKGRVLVFGVYGAGNMGDDLMQVRVAEKLRTRGVEPVFIVRPAWKHYFGLAPEPLSLDTRAPRAKPAEHGIGLFSSCHDTSWASPAQDHAGKFSAVRFPLKENYDGTGRIAKALDSAKYFAAERNFGKMDAAIFIGGGYINDEFKNLWKTGYLRAVMQKKHVPVYFTGQTAGPARTPETREALRRIYGGAEAVFVREKWSENFLSALGVESVLTGDDAFLGGSAANADGVPGSWEERADAERNPGSFGKTAENGQDAGGFAGTGDTAAARPYLIAVCKDFPGYEKYKDTFFRAVRETASRLGLAVFIVPFRREAETGEQRLSRALASFLTDAEIPVHLVCPKTPDAMEALFRGASLTLSTAYHAIVLSLKNGTPALGAYEGLYYKIKMRGIFDLYPPEVRHCVPLSEFAELAGAFTPSDRERETIAAASAQIRGRVNDAWDGMLDRIITA